MLLVYRVAVRMKRQAPIAELSQTNAAADKMMPSMMKDIENIELRMRYLDLRTVDLDAGWLGLVQIMKGPSLEPIVVYRIGQSIDKP